MCIVVFLFPRKYPWQKIDTNEQGLELLANTGIREHPSDTFLYSGLDVIVDDLNERFFLQQGSSVIDRLRESNRFHGDIRNAAVVRAAGYWAISGFHLSRQVLHGRCHGFCVLWVLNGRRAIAMGRTIVWGLSCILVFPHASVKPAASRDFLLFSWKRFIIVINVLHVRKL